MRRLFAVRWSVAMRLLVLLLGLGLGVANAWADEATKARANELYREGLAHHKAGDLKAAAGAFEASYAAHPHYKTLYNIGRTHAALERPAKAADALERFLKDGGRSIDPVRRADAEKLLAAQLEKVGTLAFELEPPHADLRIDGEVVRDTKRIRLRAGPHEVSASADGHHPTVRTVVVNPTRHERIRLVLDPQPPPEPPTGQLRVICDLADVSVTANGQKIGVTPLDAPFDLPVGAHRIRFARPGFESTTSRTTVAHGETKNIACDMQPLDVLPDSVSGTVDVNVSEAGASVHYNGWPLPPSGRVPVGPHLLEVTREGFMPWQRTVDVRAGQTNRVDAILVPTPAYRETFEAQAWNQRIAAYSVGGIGIVALVVGAGLAIHSQQLFSEWEQEQAALSASFATFPMGAEAAALRARQDDNDALGRRIETLDAASLGLAISGGVALATGIVLWAVGDSPDRYTEVSLSPAGIVASARW